MVRLKQVVGVAFAALAVVAFLLFFLKKLSVLGFWFLMGLCAAVAYIALPRWKDAK